MLVIREGVRETSKGLDMIYHKKLRGVIILSRNNKINFWTCLVRNTYWLSRRRFCLHNSFVNSELIRALKLELTLWSVLLLFSSLSGNNFTKTI